MFVFCYFNFSLLIILCVFNQISTFMLQYQGEHWNYLLHWENILMTWTLFSYSSPTDIFPRPKSHKWVQKHIINSMTIVFNKSFHVDTGGRFKNTYELLNLRALKFSPVNKIHIFQCMGMIFCVEFQRYPLKFHTKYLTHTLKDMNFIQHWNFKGS